MPSRPNIVVIMTDQQRWDTLGAYGNTHIRTPNLDRLAGEGALFEKAFVPTPLCTPSRASFFTGQYPSRHGLRANETFPLPENAPNLLPAFRQAGYATWLVGKDHVFGKQAQERLFDRVVEYGHAGRVGKDEEIDPKERALRDLRKSAMRQKFVPHEPSDARDAPTARITDAAIELVQGAGEKPFFLWLSYPDPHPPFVVAESYACLYKDQPLPDPVTRPGELDEKPVRQRVARRLMGMSDYAPEDLRRIREIYYGMITFIDDEIGRFARTLDDAGLTESTVILFLSDHGDYLGDHDMIRKSVALYDCLVRIPMFLRWPAHIPPARIKDTMAESIDLAPTLLELAGLPVPDAMEGKSLVPPLSGRSQAHKDRVFALYGVEGAPFTEQDVERVDFPAMFAHPYGWGNWVSPLVMRGRMAMVRTLEWKLVVYKGGEGELYDLVHDPDELRNLYTDPACSAIRTELTHALLEWALDTLPETPPYNAPDPPRREP